MFTPSHHVPAQMVELTINPSGMGRTPIHVTPRLVQGAGIFHIQRSELHV